MHTQNESIEPVQVDETEQPKKKFKFTFTKKHLLVGVSTVAVATAIVALLPSPKHDSQTASVTAVNQAEDANPVSSTDGYTITGAKTSPSNNNNIGGAPDVNGQSSTTGALVPQPTSASELDSISEQLQSIQSALNTNGSADNIKEIKTALGSVVSQVKDLVAESDSDISAEIQNSSQTLALQLNGMKGQLTNIQQLSQPGGYVSASNLPFTVQFIDNVAGQSVVTVNYNNLLTPISVGESLAGWTLSNADYASQTAVFQNSKDQLVKASVNVGS